MANRTGTRLASEGDVFEIASTDPWDTWRAEAGMEAYLQAGRDEHGRVIPVFGMEWADELCPQVAGRMTFLSALQVANPAFWQELRREERSKSKERIADWIIRSGIKDEWFTEIIWETVQFWGAHPDSKASRMVSGIRWFRYSTVDDMRYRILPFNPDFLTPDIYPFPVTPKGGHEPEDAFRARMRAAMERQLTDYIKRNRAIFQKNLIYLKEHAAWTARAFSGESYIKIGSETPALNNSGDYPNRVVAKAVKRFAERIGLTLGRRR